MREHGVAACAMEVSSHALVMGRVDGVVFDVAVFTNLGRDHLDFHEDVEDYFAAKASLFTPRARAARPGQRRRRLRPAAGRARPASRCGPSRRAGRRRRLARRRRRASSRTGSTFTRAPARRASAPRRGCRCTGDFNVANALCRDRGAGEAGFDAAAVAAAMAPSGGVPGRLERVDAGQDFLAVVDYAHKPDAVEAALAPLRPLTDGRLLVVLGAGGDRDPGKRPLMGEIAARLADVLVVTDDNPRSEDPAAIRAACWPGREPCRPQRAEVHEVGDRRAAIRRAVALAGPGDTVVVAGKGHETGQEVAGDGAPLRRPRRAARGAGRPG